MDDNTREPIEKMYKSLVFTEKRAAIAEQKLAIAIEALEYIKDDEWNKESYITAVAALAKIKE